MEQKNQDNILIKDDYNKQVKSMPGHYIESSIDDYSEYYDKAKAGEINSSSNSPSESENELLKLNYGSGKMGEYNEKISKGYGNYSELNDGSIQSKPNFDFNTNYTGRYRIRKL